MDKSAKQPEYVKELFEDDFFDKWIEELFYLTEDNYVFAEQAEPFREVRTVSKKELEEILFNFWDEQISNPQKYFYRKSDEKYSFKLFQEQFNESNRNCSLISLYESFIYHEDNLLKPIPKAISLTGQSDYLKEVLNFEDINITSDIISKELFGFNILNTKIFFLKILKYICIKTSNLEFKKIENEYRTPRLTRSNIDVIEFILDYIQKQFEEFKPRYALCFNHFLGFAIDESLEFALNISDLTSHMNYHAQKHYKYFNLFKQDKKKTQLIKNIDILLKQKRKLYNHLLMLPEDRRGGKKATIPEVLSDYSEKKIFKYYNFTKKLRQGKCTRTEYPQEYKLLEEVYNKKIGESEITYNSFNDYTRADVETSQSKILALEMFILENDLPIKATALNKKLKERKPKQYK